MSRRSAKHRGFTLIELIIALVIAGVLVMWAVPSLTSYIDRNTLSSAVSDWVGAIALARSEAVKRGQRVTICRRPANLPCLGDAACQCGVSIPGDSGVADYQAGYLMFTSEGNSPPLNFDPAVGNILIKSGGAMPAKVRVQGNRFVDNAFSFMPDGTLDPTNFESGEGTASHVLCLKSDAADDSTAASTSRVPGALVTISASGRPRTERLATGDSCSGSSYDTASG